MTPDRLRVRHCGPYTRPVWFWCAMGPQFASREVRRDMPFLYDDGQAWWTVFDQLGVAGFAAARRVNIVKGELVHCWVRRAWRGRGVGRMLTTMRLEYLDRAGAQVVGTVAVSGWADVLGREFGFRTISARGRYRRMERP